jgi:hypothetical protein
MRRLEDISPDSGTLLLSRGPLDTAVFSVDLAGAQKVPSRWFNGRDDLAPAVLAGRTVDFSRFLRWWSRVGSTAAEAPRAALGTWRGSGVTSRGNYPCGARMVGKSSTWMNSKPELCLVGSRGQCGRRVPGRPVPVPRSSPGDIRGSEFSGGVARWLTLL